jgi:hypothetical protein
MLLVNLRLERKATQEREMSEVEIKSGWDIESFEEARVHAEEVSESTGETYIPVDHGKYRSPRYEVTRAPHVGDEVSRSINGDYYPCGVITKISPTMKKVTTSDGSVFYRYKETGSWRKSNFWMVHGHIDRRNPHV